MFLVLELRKCAKLFYIFDNRSESILSFEVKTFCHTFQKFDRQKILRRNKPLISAIYQLE